MFYFSNAGGVACGGLHEQGMCGLHVTPTALGEMGALLTRNISSLRDCNRGKWFMKSRSASPPTAPRNSLARFRIDEIPLLNCHPEGPSLVLESILRSQHCPEHEGRFLRNDRGEVLARCGRDVPAARKPGEVRLGREQLRILQSPFAQVGLHSFGCFLSANSAA